MKKWTGRVSKEQGGIRLLAFLREECKDAPSVKALKRAIDGKCCLVNGTIQTFSSYTLHSGDRVSLELIAEQEEKPLQTLYEDEALLAVNKPAGLVVEAKAFKNGFLVHRLDKETSGVLLIAKSTSMQKALETLFKEHKLRKLYLALVDGKVVKEKGIIDRPIGKKGAYAGQTVYGVLAKGEGVRAITHYQVLNRGKAASLIACEPKTGRTHQLRVHLSFIGHPILGDRQYATKFGCSYAPKRNLLHAYQLEFEHPLTKKTVKIVAPIPSDVKEAMDTLGLRLS